MKIHWYISTACLHELHTRCRRDCKFCEQLCRCECHNPVPDIDIRPIQGAA